MDELVIMTHDFNDAINELKEFSEKIPSTVDLQSVATSGGLFHLFNHNVTGEELNNLTAEIQKHIISINTLHLEAIREFGQVYRALEALDREYIQAILASIKAAEKASSQAKESASEVQKNSLDIVKAIEVQKKTIEILTKFKKQIDEYKHLKDIDQLWQDCQRLKKDTVSTNDKTQTLESKIISIEEDIHKLMEDDETQKANQNKYNERFDESNMIYENRINKLTKQLKMSYVFAGGSAVIALISIVLNLLGAL